MPLVDTVIYAGTLRHRVRFYSVTLTKSDATGTEVPTYTDLFAETRAEMNPDGGREFFNSGRFNVEELDTCLIRYRHGIDTTMQMEFRGEFYEVLEVRDIQKRRTRMIVLLRQLDSPAE